MAQDMNPRHAEVRSSSSQHTAYSPTALDVRRVLTAIDAPVSLTHTRLEKLAHYVGLLQRWRKRINIVGPESWEKILTELVLDSLHLIPVLQHETPFTRPRCIDIGAGAGLPGIPLRIFRREGTYIMVEPRQNRAIFLHHAVSQLSLPRTRVLRSRVEELTNLRCSADIVLGRAFRTWPEYLRLAKPLLAPEGVVVVFSNALPPERLSRGWKMAHCASYTLSRGRIRYFWLIQSDVGET